MLAVENSTQSILPFVAPSVSAHEVSRNTAISELVAGFCRALGAKQTWVGEAEFQNPLVLEARVGSSDIRAIFEKAFADEIIKHHFELPADYRLPDELQSAVLEVALTNHLERLEEASGVYIRFLNIAPPDGDDFSNYQTYSVVPPGAQAVKVAVAISDDWQPIDFPSPSTNDGLPMHLPLTIGRLSLAVRDLRNLGIGDILLCPIQRSETALECTIALGGQLLAGRIAGNQLTITRSRHHMNDNTDIAEHEFEDSLPDPAADETDTAGLAAEPEEDVAAPPLDTDAEFAQPADTDATATAEPIINPRDMADIPMTVRFDVGQLSLTLQEVQALCEGTILELPADIEDLVHINVNGLYVGQGELVTIDGKAGVRVLRLNR